MRYLNRYFLCLLFLISLLIFNACKQKQITKQQQIHSLAYEGDLSSMRVIIEENPDLANSSDKSEYVPLHYACWCQHVDVVKYLLAKGANVNAKTNKGQTPLHLALTQLDRKTINFLIAKEKGKVSMPEPNDCVTSEMISNLLISNGAKINARDNEGRTPLHIALYFRDRCENLIKFLISRGADVDAEDNHKVTPLQIASGDSDKRAVKILIQNHVKVNVKDELGCSPLHQASLNLRDEIAQILIENGADVNAKDLKGDTPLVMVFMSSSHDYTNMLKMVKLLLSSGADPNVQYSPTNKPLFTEVVSTGNKDFTELFLEHNVDINIQDSKGLTAIQLAIKNGYSDIMNLLLEKGCNLNIKDKTGKTALHFASEQGNKDIAEMLISKGADVNAKDNEGKTPLALAVENGFLDIADFLRKHGGTK